MNISLSLFASSPPVIPSDDDFTYLQKHIEKENFCEAIQQLLFLLLDMSATPKIYDCLYLLVPHFTGEDMRKLDGRLFIFLQRFPIDQVQKRKLALALAEWHICHAPKDNFLIQLSSYQNAMRCFAQALKVQEEDQDPIHREASALFVRLIESIWLHKNTFQEKIAKAKSKGDIEEIQRLIDQVEILNTFCQIEQDQKIIQTLYRQARDVINQDYKETFSTCLGKISRGIRIPFAPADHLVTKKYHQALQKFRASFDDLPSHLSPLQLRHFQAEITAHFKEFLHLLFEDIFALLGPPPGEYAFLAMGSAAREELCSFSDLEPLILCQNDAVKDYFSQALALLQLMILSLGETPKTSSTQIHPLPRGLFLDGALTEVIRVPGTLASLLLSDLNANDPCTSLAHTACKTLTLCSNTTTLLESYRYELQTTLANPSNDNLPLCHHLAYALFKRRLKDYRVQWSQPPFIDKMVNIKTQYVELLYHLLADIGFYFAILENNTLDLLDALEEHKIFTLESCQLLKEAVTQIYLLRLRLHRYYQEQKEEVYTEGMTGYILSTQERTMLEKIYWLALRPLYGSLQEILTEEKPLEKIFHELDLFDKVFNEMMTSGQPLLFHLTTHLLNSNTPFGRHLIYFEKLSQHTQHEPLREAYFNAIKDHLPLEKIAHLLFIPNKSGVRLFAKNNAYKLHAHIQALIDPEPHQKQNLPQVKVFIAGQTPAYLKPAVIERLIDSEGNIRQTYPDSAHKVCALGPLHIKQKPTQPLMEYAIYSLFLRIGGHLSPTHQLVRFDVANKGKQKSYPVLISETITGKTLKENQEFRLSPQGWAKWTWMLLCAIFTRPGDGRRANYILDAYQQIFCIDNDISFVEPVVQNRFTKIIHFCCALFCLFPERPLDSDVLQAFCALDADAILHSWIEDIIEKEKEYHTLFSEEEKQKLYDEDPNNRFKVTLLFHEGTLATLNLQFISLQNALISFLQHQKALYPLDLLKEIINLRESPTLEKASGRYLFHAYQKSLSFPIQERLQQATSRPQDKSLTSLQSDPATLGKVPTWEEVEKRKLWTPTKAKEELFITLLNRTAKYLSLGKVQGRRTLRANFRHLQQQEKTPDLERQSLVLRALIYLMNRESEKPISVTLQHCATLDSTTLASFLHENLEYLDLSLCSKIKDRDIEQIQQICPFLHTLILSGCSQLVNLASSGLFATQPLDFARQDPKILQGHTSGIYALIALEGGKTLASGSDDKTIRLWDVASGQERKILKGHTGWVITLVALEGGKTLASGSDDKTIRLWDVASGQERKILKGHTSWILTLTALEGGKTFASGGSDETIRLWDVASGEQLKILQGRTHWIRTLIALEGGKTLASGSEDKTIRLWDIASGQECKILKGHTGQINALIALEEGKMLASGSEDKTIRLWDVTSGQERQILTGHTAEVKTLIALEGGKTLASGSEDKTIRLWDVSSEKELKILKGHTHHINTLIALEGEKTLVSGSTDKTIRLWNLKTGLEHLDVGHCENLRSVRIKASLKTFKANKSQQLENVEIETDCIPRLEVKQCEKLNLKHTLHAIWNGAFQSESKDLFPVLLPSSIINILAKFVKETPFYEERLLKLIAFSKIDAHLATSAANAIAILNQAQL